MGWLLLSDLKKITHYDWLKDWIISKVMKFKIGETMPWKIQKPKFDQRTKRNSVEISKKFISQVKNKYV